MPGGAGNAANNVAALGGRARLVGLVGATTPGGGWSRRCRAASSARRRARAAATARRSKTRILAGGIHSAKQQVVRIDRDAGWPLPDAAHARRSSAQIAAGAASGCDAVLVSDYGSGLVTPGSGRAVRERLRRAVAPAAGADPRRLALRAARLHAA